MTPEQLALFEKLTPLQRRVCTQLLKPGMSQRQAYYAAGGSAKSDTSADASVSQLLGNPKARAYLDAMQVQAVRSAIMEKEEALELLTEMARTKLCDIVEWARYPIASSMETGEVTEWQTGWRIKDSVEQDPAKMGMISELSAGKDGIKVKTHSRKDAMALLAKLRGWEAPQKIEASVTAKPDAKMSPQEAARAYQDLMSQES